MQTSRYRSDVHPSLDLQDENFQFYWTFRNLNNGGMIEWDIWWENFSMFASMLSFSASGGSNRQNIPIVNCETQDWWSKNIESKNLSQFTDIYFCLD